VVLGRTTIALLRSVPSHKLPGMLSLLSTQSALWILACWSLWAVRVFCLVSWMLKPLVQGPQSQNHCPVPASDDRICDMCPKWNAS
jgi:hypothetical protein